jgi:Phosphotransferase enzyme family
MVDVDAEILPPMTEAEVPLTGGTLNSVVRVGNTVRRSAGPWTPTIHALLRHVRDRGFDLAPEPFGFDDVGREVVSYLPGVTVGWSLPWPAMIRQEDLLIQVGGAMARYHRAVVDFRPEGPVPWQSGPAVLASSDLVCHHDLAPYNVVVREGRLSGIIDWDLAGPGSALSDLAFVAWQWVPLHGPLVTTLLGWTNAPNRSRRLRLLLDAYGLIDRAGFIDKVVDRIGFNRATMVRRAAEGSQGYQSLIDQGHLVGMDEALSFLADEGHQLQGRL